MKSGWTKQEAKADVHGRNNTKSVKTSFVHVVPGVGGVARFRVTVNRAVVHASSYSRVLPAYS